MRSGGARRLGADGGLRRVCLIVAFCMPCCVGGLIVGAEVDGNGSFVRWVFSAGIARDGDSYRTRRAGEEVEPSRRSILL